MATGRWAWVIVMLASAAILSAQPVPTTLPATVPTTASVKDIAGLIQALGADKNQTRQHAQDALVQIGLPAKAALEDAAKNSDSPEVRSRAATALRQIGDNQADAPTYIDINVANANPKAVLALISGQAKVPISIWPEQLWDGQWGKVPSVTLHLDHVAFWPALLQFCKAAEAYPNNVGDFNHITLTQGSGGDPGVLFQQKQYTFIATRIEHRRSINLSNHSTDNTDQIILSIFFDPKVHILTYRPPRLTEAVDDNGTSLSPANAPQGQPQKLWPCPWKLDTALALVYPEKVGSKLVRCKGVLPVCLITQTKTLRIADLTKAVGTTVSEGDRKVQVTKFNFDNGVGEMKATISQTGRSTIRVTDLFDQIRQAKIVDADGKEIQSGGGGGGSDRSVDWTWSFSANGNQQFKPPFSLVWEVVAETRDEEIPFEFDNLPLPEK